MFGCVIGDTDCVTRCLKKKLTKLLLGTTASQNPINRRDISIILVIWHGKSDWIPILKKNLASGILNLGCSLISCIGHKCESD